MIGKMMNRYYYGKSGKGDYTKDDLPTNRWQLFWEMLRVRFAGLFKFNLLYMIAWIPAMVVIGRAVMMVLSGLMNLSELQLQLEAGEIAAEVYNENQLLFFDALKVIAVQSLGLLIPAIAVTGPFTAGLAYVTRNWARDEHSFMMSDFFEALKNNWKQALLASTITGFVPMLLYVCAVFYGSMANDNMLFLVPQVLSITVGVVWLCSLMYLYPQMVTYNLKFSALVRNSLIMTVGRLPQTIGIKLLTLVPALICAAISLLTPYMQYALLILAAYYIVLGFSLSRFVQASYSNAVFDRYINPNVEGAEVGRGLYVESDDEEETENTDESADA